MADTTLERRTGRSRPNSASGRSSASAASAAVPYVVAIFIFSLIVPNYFFVGPMRLSPYKLVLLMAFVPVFFKWVSGAAGGIKSVDILIFLHCVWAFLALLVVHGAERIEAAGLYFIETFGVFLMARVYIRKPSHYRFFIKCLCWSVIIILPFGMVETMTARPIMSEIFGKISPVYANVIKDARWGLDRVQGPFEHPILFGVYCTAAVAPAYFVWGRNSNRFGKIARTTIMGIGTFISLSVGAYISFFIQFYIMLWDFFTVKLPRRWLILSLIFISAYLAIDLLSNRSPVEVFISYLTFNSGNSYNRILIWHYGTAEVARYPLFGIGFNEWERAYWMSTSMDNFWLVVAVRYGLPGFLLLMAAFLICIFKTGGLKLRVGSDADVYRTAYLVGIGGFIMALCTVHVWNANYVLLVFILGSGVWLLDHDPDEPDEFPSDDTNGPRSRDRGRDRSVNDGEVAPSELPTSRPPRPGRHSRPSRGDRPSRAGRTSR